MTKVASIVTFQPHEDHDHLADFATLAAIVGAVNPDGSASLFALVPNREPVWMDNVPPGTGSYTFSEIPDSNAVGLSARMTSLSESVQGAIRTASAASSAADEAKGLAAAAHDQVTALATPTPPSTPPEQAAQGA